MRSKNILNYTFSSFLNLSIFGYTLKMNAKNNNNLKNMSSEKLDSIKIRNYSMRENTFFNSEHPILRTMARAAYDQDDSWQTRERFRYYTRKY